MLTPTQAQDSTVICQPPDSLDMRNADHYQFVMTYKPWCAENTNWGKHFPDVTISSGEVSVTASTALAGAIASVR